MSRATISLHIDAHCVPLHQIDATAPSAGVPTGDGCLGGGEITLHIDRGGMGGGGKLDFVGKISKDEADAYADGDGGTNNREGFTTGENANFNGYGDREGIFFYCLIAHDTSESVNPTSGPIYYKGQEAWSSPSSNYLVIFNNRIDHDDQFHWLFIHEFGHQLILTIDDGTGGTVDHRSNANSWHCNNPNCCMYEKDSGGGRDESKKNFCDDCWHEIERGDYIPI